MPLPSPSASAGASLLPIGPADSSSVQRILLDALPSAAYLCDADGLITHFNAQAAELWGRTPSLHNPAERFCGSLRLYSTQGEPLPHDQCCLARVLREGRAIHRYEVVIERPDGSRVTALAHGSPLRDAAGQVIGALNVLIDISHRQQAEELRQASQGQLRQLFNASPLPAVLYSRSDGRILDVNDRFLETFGAPRDEAIGHTGWELGIWCDLAQRNLLVHRMRQEDRIQDFEARVRTRSGQEIEMLLSAQVVNLASGPAVLVQGIDVTERKSYERSLRENESRFRSVVEGSLQGILIHQDNQICYANNALAQMFDYESPTELVGRPLWETFVLPDHRAELEERTRRLLNGETLPPHPGWRAVGKSGRTIWVATSASRIEWQGRAAIVAFYLDVSERHRAEAAHRESEERLRLVIAQAPAIVWALDNELRITLSEGHTLTHLGLRAGELVGRRLQDYLQTSDPAHPLLAHHLRAISGESVEYVTQLNDRVLECHLEPMRDATGQTVGCLGVGLDVTERHQAQKALRESEARFRQLFENSPDAVFVESLQGYVLDVNPAACRLHGLTREELIGKSVLDLVPPERRPDVERDFARLAHGELDGIEGFSRRQDGQEVPVAIRTSLIEFDGQAALLLHVRDVTEQKRAEQALRDSEVRLRTLLEALDNVAVQGYEADGTISFWNQASEQLYGYSAQYALGRDVVELLHAPATRDEERRIMAEALATGRVQPAEEVEVLRRDGRRIWVYASRVLHARPGRPPEFFCFDVDITDRKRAEEELALRQAELLHAARLSSVGQMVAALSHEVAQPLSAIGNFAAASALLLERDPRDSWDLLKEYNQAVSKQNQRCGAILERLRNFSRRTEAQRSAADVNHLLRESAELMAHEIRRAGIKVHFELAERLPPVICDRVQIEQVVVNLLANARDALRDQDAEERQITIRSRQAQGGVVLEVEDRGCGLAPEVAQRLFEPFVTTKTGGMGIGLSICRTILRDHGGTIEAATGPVRGAIFRIRLPAALRLAANAATPE